MVEKKAVYRCLLVGWVVLLSLFGSMTLQAEESPFPIFPSIRPNVDFWERIYSVYSSEQGVIHDTTDLRIVYEVIDLVPRHVRRSRKINKRRISSTKKRYRKILERLIMDVSADSPEEVRVLSMFGDAVDRDTLIKARDEIRFQRGQKDRFRRGIIRSGAYIGQIKAIFRREGLPEDLAYLPHVESSFNYKAYSKFGAAGIWQFTYGTGRQYMKVDYTVDERRDPIRASIAAARLLRSNFRKLNSWPLAITAYNHGVNSMMRAKKRVGDYEAIFNGYAGRRFKFASRNFYPEFLAARKIAKERKIHFGELTLEPQLDTREFIMPGFSSIREMSAYFRVTPSVIRKLNPALRRPVFKNQKYIPRGYRLRLPARSDLKGLMANVTPRLFKKKQKRSLWYHVRRGDAAITIARRHQITLQELVWANNLDYRARIYAGQNLRIPKPEDRPFLEAKYKKEQEKLRVEVAGKPPGVAPPSDAKLVTIIDIKSGKGEGRKLTINPAALMGDVEVKRLFKRKGRLYGVIQAETRETIGHYAEWLKTPARQIRRLNGFSFNRGIRYRDRIIIPLYRISKDRFEEKRYEYHQEYEEDFLSAFKIESVWLYKVKRGESIWGLCKESFDLPFWLIKKYNTNIDFSRLRPGQELVIPVVEEKRDRQSM